MNFQCFDLDLKKLFWFGQFSVFVSGQSGYVESKYCTTSAKYCYGSNGQNKYVAFKKAFKAPPKVMIGLTLVDSNKDQNVRVRVSADSITKKGFNIKFKPWNSSITYQMGVNWMACPWTWFNFVASTYTDLYSVFSLYYSQLLSIEILDFNVINKLVNILLCFKFHLSWLFNFTLAACPLFIHCKTGNLSILNPRFTRLVKKLYSSTNARYWNRIWLD